MAHHVRPHVLLVEPDDVCRELLRDVLVEQGFDTICVAQAEEAKALTRTLRKPRMVILDWSPRCRLAFPSLSEVKSCLGLEADDELVVMTRSQTQLRNQPHVLRKPFELSELFSLVADRL